MIRARIDAGPGRKIYLLGLTDGNVAKLTAGQPVYLNLAELGGVGEVCIMHGADKLAIVAELEREGVDVPETMRREAEADPT